MRILVLQFSNRRFKVQTHRLLVLEIPHEFETGSTSYVGDGVKLLAVSDFSGELINLPLPFIFKGTVVKEGILQP